MKNLKNKTEKNQWRKQQWNPNLEVIAIPSIHLSIYVLYKLFWNSQGTNIFYDSVVSIKEMIIKKKYNI